MIIITISIIEAPTLCARGLRRTQRRCGVGDGVVEGSPCGAEQDVTASRSVEDSAGRWEEWRWHFWTCRGMLWTHYWRDVCFLDLLQHPVGPWDAFSPVAWSGLVCTKAQNHKLMIPKIDLRPPPNFWTSAFSLGPVSIFEPGDLLTDRETAVNFCTPLL